MGFICCQKLFDLNAVKKHIFKSFMILEIPILVRDYKVYFITRLKSAVYFEGEKLAFYVVKTSALHSVDISNS